MVNLPELLGKAGLFFHVIAEPLPWLRPLPLAIFVVSVFIYFSTNNRRLQNGIILGLGGFIAWYVSIIFFAQLFIYAAIQSFLAIQIHKSSSPIVRKVLVAISIIAGIGIIVFLRSQSIQGEVILLLAPLHLPGLPQTPVLNFFIIAVPIFSMLTLTADAYYDKIRPAPSFWRAMIFSTFFSRYNALPVERARDFLPRFSEVRKWNAKMAEEGVITILQGLVKFALSNGFVQLIVKLNGSESTGLSLLLVFWLMAIQIWLEFSGGVDLTIGFARIMGIKVAPNFDAPFLSTNVADFWRRWNMGFTAWLGEEIFTRISFATRKWGYLGTGAACFLTYLASALGHSASADGLLWGGVWGSIFLIYFIYRNKVRKFAKNHNNPKWLTILSWFVTSHIVILIWGLLEYKSFHELSDHFLRLFSGPVFNLRDSHVNWVTLGLAIVAAVYLHNKPHFSKDEFWIAKLKLWEKIPAILLMILCIIIYTPVG
jgi:alginate O-acetyltransferase complex protein AlgI